MIRRLHPDFHIPPEITNVGAKFDGDSFADSLASAGVDSVVIFAKCHYGHAYWNTTVGRRHPGLGERDLFGEAVEACRQRGIEVLAYYSALVDGVAGENESWRQRDAEGNIVGTPPFRIQVCPNTDYTENYLLPQMREVTKNYPISGWHVDAIRVTGGCWCECCREIMKEEGINSDNPEEMAEFRRRTIYILLQKMTETVRSEREGLILSYSNLLKIGCRPQVKWSDVVDVEVSLSTLNKASLFSRHIRTIGRKFALTTSCRSRGVAAYGSLATVEELRYAAGLGLSLGGYCQFICEMLPEGKLESPVLRRVKGAFDFVKERERWCVGAQQSRYVAIMGATEPDATKREPQSAILGATRLLRECHLPFDIIDEGTDLSPYKLVILPETDITEPDVLDRLREHVQNGGVLFATGSATLKDEKFGLSNLFGVNYQGEGDDISYFRLGPDVSANLLDMVRLVRGKWLKVEPEEKAERLGEIVRPRFVDTGLKIGWGRPPEQKDSGWPAIVCNRFGSGWTLYSPAPLFTDYAQAPDEEQRRFMNNLLNLVAPANERPVLIPDLPPSAEISLMEKEGMWILHIIRGGSFAPPELRNVKVILRPDFKPARVYLAPEQQEVSFRLEDSEARVVLSCVGSYTILVLEP